MVNIFIDIAIVMTIAGILAYIFGILKQPTILAYILTGVILKLLAPNLIQHQNIETLSSIGITFLLFIVGLEMSIKKLKEIKKNIVVVSLAQMTIIFFITFILLSLFNFKTITAIYLSLFTVLSSTALVIKLLIDKQQIDTLHARLIIAILLLQDIIAIFAISLLSHPLNLSSLNSNLYDFIISPLKVLIMILMAILMSRLLPYIFRNIAKDKEKLLVISLSLCFFFVLIAYFFDISIAIGAFLAGITLANLDYRTEIYSIICPIKNFFVSLFFISLGLFIMLPSDMSNFITLTLILILVTLLIKPAFIFLSVRILGYTNRVAHLVAVSLGQSSELFLVLIPIGLRFGHISNDVVASAIFTTIITAAITPYVFNKEYTIYKSLKKLYKKIKLHEDKSLHQPKKAYNTILVGHDRAGYEILKTLVNLGKKVLIIDYNPVIVKRLKQRSLNVLYGDINDIELIDSLDLKKTKLVISTAPDFNGNLLLLKRVKDVNPKCKVILTSYDIDEALVLYEFGADYVIIPHLIGGKHVSLLLQRFSDNMENIIKERKNHIHELYERKELSSTNMP